MPSSQSSSQTMLQSSYEHWKRDFRETRLDLRRFSPPLLLNASDVYDPDKRNAIVFGQETFGWSWTRKLTEEFPGYEKEYRFNDQNSLFDFFNNDDAVDALCWGYKEFDFASKQPSTARSPFWRAFREITTWGFDDVMWSNLAKCDYEGGKVLQLDEDLRKAFFNAQAGLLHSELGILKPKSAIFFTGPNYDPFLKICFPGISFVSAGEMVDRLSHPSLPKGSFRTYHPSYLQQSGNWRVIEGLRSLVGSA
jgi:hypothetical protein